MKCKNILLILRDVCIDVIVLYHMILNYYDIIILAHVLGCGYCEGVDK